MILTLSPSGLNNLQECPTKYNFSNLRRLQLVEAKTTRMDEGSLIHSMLELHYNSIIEGKSIQEIILEVTEYAREKYRNDEYEFAIVEDCIRNYQEYAVYYESDGWKPKAAEVPFSKIIYEDGNHKIVMEGIIDLITENLNSQSFPVDHKSVVKRDQYPTILSNQFKCYAWATESFVLVKNDIGFQKTLWPGERFQRHILNYTKEMLEEWRENVIYHGLELIHFIEKDYFPRRESACWKCWYKQICESTPDAREYKIGSKYKIGDPHDIYGKRS